MKTRIVGRGLLAVAFFAAWSATTAASAGVFRAYLSSTGNDAFPCSLAAPCRLLPAALAAVVSGGEITLLDSANYNAGQVIITKSVTIAGNPGTSASVAAIGALAAIRINTAGVKVTLRNLAILSYGATLASNGIEFAQGAAFHMEDCQVVNIRQHGILVTAPSSAVTIRNTVLRNSGGYAFIASGSSHSVLEGVRMEGNFTAIGIDSGARGTVSNSTFADNYYGLYVAGHSAITSFVVRNSVFEGNNTVFLIFAPPSTTATAFSDANSFADNGTAFNFQGSGGTEIIYTRQNNTGAYNGGTSGATALGAF